MVVKGHPFPAFINSEFDRSRNLGERMDDGMVLMERDKLKLCLHGVLYVGVSIGFLFGAFAMWLVENWEKLK